MIETRRLAKQLIYAGFYTVVLGAIAYGVYVFFLKPAESCFDNKLNQDETEIDCGGLRCESCDIRRLKPIEVISANLFFLNGSASLIELYNPNPTYGADLVSYAIALLDASGATLKTVDETTFIYPGERKYILKTFDFGTDIKNLHVTIAGKPDWRPAKSYSLPNMRFVGAHYANAGDKLLATGDIQNNETLLFPNIKIGAIFRDKNGTLLGVSQTDVRDVRAFESRFFQIEHPIIPNADLSRTELFFEAQRP